MSPSTSALNSDSDAIAPLRSVPLTLASASPRRRELLALLGQPFEVLATDGEDRAIPLPSALAAALPPWPLPLDQHPTMLAWRKVVAACVEAPSGVIIGADTTVVIGTSVLNKPRDAAHASEMLARLSGNEHSVYTGLAVLMPPFADQVVPEGAIDLAEGRLLIDLVSARVRIMSLSPAMIASYVASGEPLDKAGAYGIQGLAGRLVERVEGSYTAVVGLPLPATARLLEQAGIRGLADPSEAYCRWLQAKGKDPLPCPPTLP